MKTKSLCSIFLALGCLLSSGCGMSDKEYCRKSSETAKKKPLGTLMPQGEFAEEEFLKEFDQYLREAQQARARIGKMLRREG